MQLSDYESSVFINCPFDKQYENLFEAVLFTIFMCGFKPRCALEHDDAGQQRIEKINSIIYECKYGFHDISRTELEPENKLPRFNMPLELGLFLGCKRFASGRSKDKICMIFDSDRYRYQKFISDIAGQDIKKHDNNPHSIIKGLRKIFATNHHDMKIIGAAKIIESFEKFHESKPEIIAKLELDADDLVYVDSVAVIQQWLKINL
jgi:hypothetical protein